jgi:hypothetical protein
MTTGIFNTAGVGSTPNLIKPSFAQLITRLAPNGSVPLFGMTSMLPTETAVKPEHGFFTKTMVFPSLTSSLAALSTDVTMYVASSANVLQNMLMRNQRTSEVIMIAGVSGPTQVQIIRGIGSTATAVNVSDKWYQIGTAFEESSVRPNALQINPVQITNLTQTFRNTWAVSGSAAETQVIAGEATVAESKQDCAGFHAVDIETGLIFGVKSSGVRNGQPFRTMDGLLSIVGNLSYYPPGTAATNVYTAGSTTNYTQLKNMLDPVFNQMTDPKAGSERALFVGGGAFNVINDIGRLNGQYQLVDGQNSYGLQFNSFRIPRGKFNMVQHGLFNSNADWSKLAVAVDMSSFRVAYLGKRKTMYQDILGDDGIDAVGGTLTTELTAVVKNPPANAVIWNLTAGAAG